MSLKITNVHLPFEDALRAGRLYAVTCAGGTVQSVVPMDGDEDEGPRPGRAGDKGGDGDAEGAVAVLDGGGGLLIPSLCHAHIHLDKCYILAKGAPLVTGDFAEALRVTARAKAAFRADADDLFARGARLVRASVAAGVTCMRAHVEVDRTVGDACVRAALRLKAAWRGVCDVLICVFMQDPFFDDAESAEADVLRGGENARLLDAVLSEYAGTAHDPNAGLISAVGSAPYVERTRAQQLANIAHVLGLARTHGLHVDFHLDYDLAPLTGAGGGAGADPLIWRVLAHLEDRAAGLAPHTAVTIGHATRLTRFPPARLRELCARIGALAEGRAGTPCTLHVVGLPQSDVYMMGRRARDGDGDEEEEAYDAPRGTVNVVRLRTAYGLATAAMAVNNVGNAFTPQGAPDPLGLCALGVAVYQDGTARGCRALLEAVTFAAKHAVGERGAPATLLPACGCAADFVLLHENATAAEAALAPGYARTTVKGGRVVAWRRAECWDAGGLR